MMTEPRTPPATAPRAFVVLADHVDGSRELTRAALEASGTTTVLLAAPDEINSVLPAGRQADVLVVDVDFGGRGQGMRMVESALRLSDVTVILVGTDLDTSPIHALSDRCHMLHRPVHAGQLRTTVRLALAQSHRRRTTARLDPAAPGASVAPVASRAERALRPREREVARLLHEHHRVPAVARALGISAHTVRNHLKNIYRRLGVHSQLEMIRVLYGPQR